MGRYGENSGRQELEIMQECWERTGVWWKNRGGEWIREQEVLKGESQEATGKQDALILQTVGVS